MKKVLLSIGLILCSFVAALAQQAQPLPIDPKVRYGKLESGLTYYIRHNELPKQRADFYIAQDVGAILEEDNQNGLAHFLEHMAFHSSKNFPNNSMIGYLESIGVKFGENLNAGTGFDQTVYNISNVPVVREGIIDSCLLVLHDWSGFLSLADEDIEKERGVIREEMRFRGDANQRMDEKIWSQIMPGSQYSKRNIIGTADIILNFKPETLRAYYKKWYRPDLQAIIIIGDIDVDKIESKLKAVFSDHPAQQNPAERTRYTVADNTEPLVGIASDKEATQTFFYINFKHKPLQKEIKGTINGVMTNYLNSIVSAIMKERLTEISRQANPPFVNANVINDLFANTATEEALIGYALIKGNEIETGVKSIVRELERVKKYGFNASEYERAKTNLLTYYENAAKEKDKIENSGYAEEYVKHFIEGGYIPGIEMENTIMSSIAPQISVEMINQYIRKMICDTNVVMTLTAPEKEDYTLPTKDLLLKWYQEARSEDIQALKETVNNEPLLSEMPSGGKVKSVSTDAKFGTTVWVLSNGVKVVIKPTDFKDNEILMAATSPGGSSHFPESEATNIKLYNNIANLGGLGKFSATDLTKVLAGKKVSVTPEMSLLYEGFSGSSSIKDFETMLQLIYLNFTAPRKDEAVYQSFVTRIKPLLETQEAAPEIAMVDTLMKEVYVDPIRSDRLKAKDMDKVNYQTIMDWRKDRYADASDFTFVFTGNIKPDESKGLIEKYLGSLPSIRRKESFVPVNADFRPGINENKFEQKMENPKASTMNWYWTTFEPTMKNRIEMDMLQNILTIIYTEKIRKEEGGTYFVQVFSAIADYPKGQTPMQIYFDTQPGKEDYLNGIIHAELQKIADEGPGQEEFEKVKENLTKQRQEDERQNAFWSKTVINYYRENYDGYTDYKKTLDAVKPADIQKKAQAILNSKNLIEVVMVGVKK